MTLLNAQLHQLICLLTRTLMLLLFPDKPMDCVLAPEKGHGGLYLGSIDAADDKDLLSANGIKAVVSALATGPPILDSSVRRLVHISSQNLTAKVDRGNRPRRLPAEPLLRLGIQLHRSPPHPYQRPRSLLGRHLQVDYPSGRYTNMHIHNASLPHPEIHLDSLPSDLPHHLSQEMRMP